LDFGELQAELSEQLGFLNPGGSVEVFPATSPAPL
jgi:hypothetical protein